MYHCIEYAKPDSIRDRKEVQILRTDIGWQIDAYLRSNIFLSIFIGDKGEVMVTQADFLEMRDNGEGKSVPYIMNIKEVVDWKTIKEFSDLMKEIRELVPKKIKEPLFTVLEKSFKTF